jgi:predicted transcriptional regulator
MPPKRSITLTEAELRLMRILWERGESAVAEIVAAVAEQGPLAYTSVLTTIRVLESKGYVTHRQEGRAFLYTPTLAEQEAGRSEVRHLLRRFFGDSRESLLLSLLGDEDVTPDELQRLRQAIAEAAEDRAAAPSRRKEGTGKA